MGRPAVELSVYPLVGLLKRARLGDPHPVLAGGERYVSGRVGADRWLEAELAEAGLADRGRLADFTGMLTIVQRAHTEFYGWVTSDGETYSVLVAAYGRNAFAVTRRNDRVAFRRISPDRLAGALVEQLGEVPPGRGEPISVREAEVTRAGPRAVLRRASVRSEQARRLDALLRVPRRGGAKLYAARRDDTGQRVRSRTWLDLIDLADGRWVVYTTAGRGERTVHAVAATSRLVGEKLDGLLRW